MQVFTNDSFTTVYPLDLKAKVVQALTEFAVDVGIPNSLLSDFMKEVNRLNVKLKRSEVGQSNQNYAAEREIGKPRKQWRTACGITTWYMRPTSWKGFPAGNSSALGLTLSLAKRQT
jgi:hypothetical protein